MNQEPKPPIRGQPSHVLDETMISYGLVLKLPVERLADLKKAIGEVQGAEVLYQKASVMRLEIIEVERTTRQRGGRR